MKNNHVKVWVALMTFSYLATLKFPCRFQKLQKIEENDQYRSGIAGYICCIIGWFGRFPTTKIARSFWCIAGEQMNSYSVVTTITSANKCSTLTTTTSKTPCSCRWCRFPQFIAVQQGAFMWDRGVPWGWAKWIHVCPTCMWSLGSSWRFWRHVWNPVNSGQLFGGPKFNCKGASKDICSWWFSTNEKLPARISVVKNLKTHFMSPACFLLGFLFWRDPFSSDSSLKSKQLTPETKTPQTIKNDIQRT